jgi:hypothetical protein
VELDEINRRTVVGLCRLIAGRSTKIPFGFTYNGVYFTGAGDYISHGAGHGLTCATFVMAVFATYNIPILKIDEWPKRPDDPGWQLGQVGHLQRRHGPFVADAAAQFIGEPRYRPEEVAAGTISREKPLTFAKAVALGRRISRDLLKSYSGAPP